MSCKENVLELMRELDIHDMSDINALFKELFGDILENGLEAKLDDELGYSKYDYRSKGTDNSRNGRSAKTMKTRFGEVDIAVPLDRKGEFEPQLLYRDSQENQIATQNLPRTTIPKIYSLFIHCRIIFFIAGNASNIISCNKIRIVFQFLS